MILSDRWETLQEIKKRTQKTAEEVIEAVKIGLKNKTVNCLFSADKASLKFRLQKWKSN